ncbi:MAG TPA: class I SAM-dependent methyltransferase [Acidobacteriaceae bacterium]|nr:class I SAM-dependent methyltransferase [Acidobacteriaceae bacterium]
MKYQVRPAWRFARAHMGVERLKKQADTRLDQPEELVSLLFRFADSELKPFQIDEELASLAKEVRDLSPMNVLEIGTAKGGTLFLWTRLAQRDAVIVSIDLPGGKFGGGYSNRRATIYRRFARKGQQLHLMREDSHAQATFEKAKQLFGEKPVDLLFIDGDHTYEGVKRDWEMYSQLVRAGGLIVFHDIAGNYDDTQVKRLWDSIKSDYKYREYAVHPDGLYGIGVLVK